MATSRPATAAPASAVPFYCLALRIGILLALQAGLILAVKSRGVAQWIGRPLAGHLHYGPEPMHAAALLGGILLLLWYRSPTLRRTRGRPRLRHIIASLLAVSVLVALVLHLTHPSGDAANLYTDGIGENVRPTAFAALRYTLLMVVLVPSAFLTFPPAFLRQQRPLLLVAFVVLIGYMWLAVLRVALHGAVAPALLRASYVVLSLLSDEAAVWPETFRLANGDFSVLVGPPCLGLDSLTLFLCLWLFVCWSFSRHHQIRTSRAITGLLIGFVMLMLLNAVRIALIVLVGTHFPEFAVGAFHSSLGAALFFLVFMCCLWWLQPGES